MTFLIEIFICKIEAKQAWEDACAQIGDVEELTAHRDELKEKVEGFSAAEQVIRHGLFRLSRFGSKDFLL